MMSEAHSPVREVTFPEKLSCLFQPSRYKVLWGGRGSGKSWGCARALLIMGTQRPLRVLCARELQNSIAESVHKLLESQIEEMGFAPYYEVQQKTIIGTNGTEFFFEGIRHNVGRIRSYEGIDYCWIEEANNITKDSWQVLTPTVRRPGSEIWVTYNPTLESDYIHQLFQRTPPEGAIVMELNWRDNKWFPPELRNEMEEMKERDPDAYLHVYEGHCRLLLEGAVYAQELRACAEEHRICVVPHEPTIPVDVFFDLGYADMTAVLCRQRVGFEWRYINYHQNRQKPLRYYLDWLQQHPYLYGTFWLPHDAQAKQLGSGMSIEEQVRRTGRQVRIVKKLSIVDGIDAARAHLETSYFDAEKCEDLVRALRQYRYEVVDASGQLSRVPVHDDASHGADAFRYAAVSTASGRSLDTEERLERLRPRTAFLGKLFEPVASGIGWMK